MKLIATLRRVADRADELGMSTSEYAVGTLGACTIGGVLVKLFDPAVHTALEPDPALLQQYRVDRRWVLVERPTKPTGDHSRRRIPQPVAKDFRFPPRVKAA